MNGDEADFYAGWVETGTEESLNIGKLPGRKQHAIYLMEPGVIHCCGYFRDRESAERVADAIGRLFSKAITKEQP